MPSAAPEIAFDNTFARELEGLYTPAEGAGFPSPKLVKCNTALAKELGFDVDALADDAAAAMFSGNALPPGSAPLAQAYAGHQFGGFSPQLGDGRALLVGEVVDVHGRRRDIQLKGSGQTPFSRRGDGRATLGPILREYLLGEAMHGLGIPTTRVLGVATTGELVHREQTLPGAVLARVASSHIRVGTFEFFAARQDHDKLRRLADYTIARHYREHATADNPYRELLGAVGQAQAELTANWMHVGFIHGVMNTDNVAISGETIDYGPCAFMDAYDPATVFSSIDRDGRYSYGNQPGITQWNLLRFAESLLPLLAGDSDGAVEIARDVLDQFAPAYEQAWSEGMRAKLGLQRSEAGDHTLAEDLLSAMDEHSADFTSAFRALSNAARGDDSAFAATFDDPDAARPWLERWRTRVGREEREPQAIADAMDRVNPIYIARNHKTEEALAAAVHDGDLQPFEALLEAVSNPFVERPSLGDYATPAPADFGPYRTFCGT